MAEQSTMTLDAQIVRRFLAKAYGDDHPAMDALKNMERDALSLERALRFAKSKAYSDFLDRTRSPATLHGDFGAMEFVPKLCSPWIGVK